MDSMSGIPFVPLEMNAEGGSAGAAAAAAALATLGITDLVVISHGWNNDKDEARALYEALFANLAPKLDALGRARSFAILGVFWPSKRFADDELLPSGAFGRAAASSVPAGPTVAVVAAKFETLARYVGKSGLQDVEQVKALVAKLDDSPRARKEFVELVRSLLTRPPSDVHDDASDKFFAQDGNAMLERLAVPVTGERSMPRDGTGGVARVDRTAGGQSGAAAGLGDVLTGIRAGAFRLLNFATYYEMKERAGTVGKALHGFLADVAARHPGLSMHLIGHSFGARVVTAAANGPRRLGARSLVLLQAAFSHNGFAERFDGTRDGFFRDVVAKRRIDGPILVTHTVNDKAVGVAYPLASRLSGDNRLTLGDRDDPFGGLGRNGAVRLAASEVAEGTLLPTDGRYSFGRKVHNLLADAFVSDHGDVAGPQVANAVAQAIGQAVGSRAGA